MCSTVGQQKFMFVDEQALAKGLSRRPRDEKSAILSYAQVRRRAREKRSQKEDAEDAARKDSDVKLLAKASSPHVFRYQKNVLGSDPLAQSYLGDNNLDPFYCTIAGQDGRPLFFMKPALAKIEASVFLAESFAPPHAIERDCRTVLDSTVAKMQRSVSDPTVMYSLLASGSAYLGWMQGSFCNTEMPEYYLGKVLEPVRLRVMDANRPPDLWLLFSVYALANTEMWSAMPELWVNHPEKLSWVDPSRLETSKMHLRALCALVEQIGGWKKVDFFLLNDCILMAKFLALREMNPPILPLTWDPGPHNNDIIYTSQTEQLSMLMFGWRHMDLPQAPELHQIIADTIEFMRAAESAWQGTPKCPTRKYLFLRNQALVYRLLNLQGLPIVDDCIRHATLIFILMSTGYKGAQLGASSTSRFLKHKIEEARDSGIKIDEDVLLWCACTGAMGSQPWDQQPWFVDLAATVCRKSGMVPTYEAVRREISAFLFLETKQEKRLRNLVELISEEF